VAAVGRRVSTLCQGEDGLLEQLAVFHCYDNFHTPSNLVVAHWTADVESNAPFDFLLRHAL
jgi:hypothetical protein